MPVDKVQQTLKEKYTAEVVPAYMEKFNTANPLDVPKPQKVSINIGTGDESKDQAALEKIQRALTLLSGQKAVFTYAKKSIAGFNIRQGDIVGVRVTLRRTLMWDFLDKLVNIVLPRVKDFKGIPLDGFDRYGNYTFGIREYLVFPEVNPVKIDKVKGLSVTIVFNNSTPEKSRFIMEKMGFVFKS